MSTGLPAAGLDEALARLPHRPPFRFVDAVDELVPGERVVGRYRVTGEALAQAGAVALLADERFAGSLPLFGRVEETKFRRVVRPGDEMVLDVTMERLGRRGGWGRGVARVGDAVCCQAQRACTDPLDRFHGVDDLQNRELFRRLQERHSAPEPSMRLNDPAPGEALEHFGKISSRNSRRLRDLIGCPSNRRLAGQMDDRSEGILHSLRKHKKSSSRH